MNRRRLPKLYIIPFLFLLFLLSCREKKIAGPIEFEWGDPINRKVIWLPISIGNKVYKVQLDTGATSKFILKKNIPESLNLPFLDFKLGNTDFEKIKTRQSNSRGNDKYIGLLGLPLFKNKIIALDPFERRFFVLDSWQELPQFYQKLDFVKIKAKIKENRFLIPIRFNNATIQDMMLDLGSTDVALNKEMWEELVSPEGQSTITEWSWGRQIELVYGYPKFKIYIGNQILEKPKIFYSDARNFQFNQYRTPLQGLIGISALAFQFIIAVDFQSSILYLAKKPISDSDQ